MLDFRYSLTLSSDRVMVQPAAERSAEASDSSKACSIFKPPFMFSRPEKVDQVGVVEGCKQGKEFLYAKIEMVRKLFLCYRDVREICLVNSFSELGEVDA